MVGQYHAERRAWAEGQAAERRAVRRRVRGAARATFRSMTERNFRLFFTGQLISQVGNWLTMIAMTLLVLHLTDNGLAIGVLAACQFGPVLILGAWAGLVADRSDKRKLLVIVQSVAMAQSFALALLAFRGDPPLLAIYAVALVGGVTVAFDNPARRAFVVEMVPEESVQNAVSLNSALMTGSRIIGPALAGLLVATVGYGWCFTVDAISYIAVIACLLMMRPAELRTPEPAPRAKGQVRAGLRYVHKVPELWIPLVMMAVIGALAFNFQVVMPLFVQRDLGGGDMAFTLLYAVISIGSLAGALLTAHRTHVDVRHLVLAALAFGASMIVLAVVPGLGFAFPVGLAVGGASIVFMTTSTAIVQLRSDPAMRGRVLALQAIVFLGSTPIGGPLLGAICDWFGPRAGVLLGGLACLAAAGWGSYAMRRDGLRGGDSIDEPLPAFANRG